MQAGRRVVFAVETGWYRTLQEHWFLIGAQIGGYPTDLLTGTVESDDLNGIWMKPDEECSDFPKGSLYVPWRFVVSAVLLGPDDERRLIGFNSASTSIASQGA